MSDASELHAWLTDKRIRAVFVDSRNTSRPGLVALMEAGLGSQFAIGYRSESGRLRVFLLLAEADD